MHCYMIEAALCRVPLSLYFFKAHLLFEDVDNF